MIMNNACHYRPYSPVLAQTGKKMSQTRNPHPPGSQRATKQCGPLLPRGRRRRGPPVIQGSSCCSQPVADDHAGHAHGHFPESILTQWATQLGLVSVAERCAGDLGVTQRGSVASLLATTLQSTKTHTCYLCLAQYAVLLNLLWPFSSTIQRLGG
jgi:hypothetical protein